MFKGRVSALADIGCENSAGLGYGFRNRSEAHVSNFGFAFLSPNSEVTSHYFSRKKTRVLIICFARTYWRCATKFLTLRLLMSYIYGAPILDVSSSHTTSQHTR